MPDTGLKRSPKFQKGALVQMVEDILGVIPNVIPFQYNPEKISHSLTPWNPFKVDQTYLHLNSSKSIQNLHNITQENYK